MVWDCTLYSVVYIYYIAFEVHVPELDHLMATRRCEQSRISAESGMHANGLREHREREAWPEKF